MTEAEQQRHLAIRTARSAGILSDIANHKVCEVCRSISKLSAAVCPICHAYQWDCNPDSVRETAGIIGSTPFPITAGTVPRLKAVGLFDPRILG